MKPNPLAAGLQLSRRESLVALAGLATLPALGLPVAVHAASAAEPKWQELSKEFLIDKDLTYLNTGSLGGLPKPVIEERRKIESLLESNPVGEGFGSVLRDAEAVAGKVAQLIGADPKNVTLTRNTTEGVNFVAEGINLQSGQRVLTSNQEHGGGLGAWKYLKKVRGIEIDVAEIASPPESEDAIVDSFKKAIRKETRVIFCSHVTFSNGVNVPISRLSELAHSHNCLMIVDGAQAAGGIPVDVIALGCDAYACSGHKHLLGPKGTGFLYIAEKARDQIKPMQLDDGYGFYTAIRGTNCMPEVIGLGQSIDWITKIGRDVVLARVMSMRNSLYEILKKQNHVKIDSPPPGSSMASNLVCFSIPDRTRYAKLQEQFGKDKVIVKGVHINGIDHRLTVHLYNTQMDLDKFAASLKKGLA